MHFGEWEGRSWQELQREDADRLGRWMSDWITTRAPGGESFADLVARTSGWLEEWGASDRGAEKATVVVAHAGSIRAMLCRLLRVPLEDAFGLEVGHARVTVVDLAAGVGRLVLTNADAWTEPLCGGDNACGMVAGQSVEQH
jgi:broad specificity phosphatase PhoE